MRGASTNPVCMRSSTTITRRAHATRRSKQRSESGITGAILIDDVVPNRRKRRRRIRLQSGARPVLLVFVFSVILLVIIVRNRNGHFKGQSQIGLVLVDLPTTLQVHGSRKVRRPPPLNVDERTVMDEPDFGGLTIFDEPPEISYDRDAKIFEKFQPRDDKTLVKKFDWYYYAFDDDENRNPYQGYKDDAIAKTRHCRRVSWHRDFFPNCNDFHSTNLPLLATDKGVRYIG